MSNALKGEAGASRTMSRSQTCCAGSVGTDLPKEVVSSQQRTLTKGKYYQERTQLLVKTVLGEEMAVATVA